MEFPHTQTYFRRMINGMTAFHSVPALALILALSSSSRASENPFPYGVASGDPMADRVLIWTYFEHEASSDQLVQWEVATDSLFIQPVQSGRYTVKPGMYNGRVLLDVTGLSAYTFYYYRFRWNEFISLTGRTKTAPDGACANLKLAVVSCQNYQAGYYNAYAHLAGRNDIDAVLHLGDYIYEYPAGYYGNSSTGRKHDPPHEIVSDEDYMRRYAQYRSDPDLQKAHARFPFISIWDDHEFANDSHVTGAQNHQSDQEGSWNTRREAARRAYYTWIPVRQQQEGKLYRSFEFGNLATLWMLDERQEARSPQVKSADDPNYRDANRYILGKEQLEWLKTGMTASTSAWRIIGNQVIMSAIDASKVMPKNPKFMDMWDGYPAERDRVLEFMEKDSMHNVIVVSGDSHTSWAVDLVRDVSTYSRKSCAGCVGAEFATPSISSANYDEYVRKWMAKEAERRFSRWGRNPQVHEKNLRHHGYLVITLNSEEAVAEWIFMRDISEPDIATRKGMSYRLSADKPGIHHVH
jgi:alkaline phosphatase D